MSTPSILTLNQIIKLMKNFQENHPMLNDFDFGNTSEIGTSRQMEMPYLWSTMQDSSVEIANKTIIPHYNFVLLFCDKLNNQKNILNANGENSNNGQEVISDMDQIVLDFLTEVNNNWGQYGVSFVEGTASRFPVIDETDDKVNGIGLNIEFRVKYVNCVFPF